MPATCSTTLARSVGSSTSSRSSSPWRIVATGGKLTPAVASAARTSSRDDGRSSMRKRSPPSRVDSRVIVRTPGGQTPVCLACWACLSCARGTRAPSWRRHCGRASRTTVTRASSVGRSSSLPAKISAAAPSARSAARSSSPSAHDTASVRLLLPVPLRPTKTFTPGMSSRPFHSGKLLNPSTARYFRYMMGLPLVGTAAPQHGSRRAQRFVVNGGLRPPFPVSRPTRRHRNRRRWSCVRAPSTLASPPPHTGAYRG